MAKAKASLKTRPRDLIAFQTRMGWSNAFTATRLGVSVNKLRQMKEGDTRIRPYIGLALAALYMGAPPYRAS